LKKTLKGRGFSFRKLLNTLNIGMEFTLEFVLAFTLFSLALATGLYWIALESLPQPHQLNPRACSYPVHLTVYREGDELVVSSAEGFTVAVSVVCFNPDGSYRVYSGETEFRLPVYSFVVVFSGSCIEYWGTPPRVSGYVAPHGFYSNRLDPPHLRLIGGNIVEIRPEEYSKNAYGIRRLVVFEGCVMVGGSSFSFSRDEY